MLLLLNNYYMPTTFKGYIDSPNTTSRTQASRTGREEDSRRWLNTNGCTRDSWRARFRAQGAITSSPRTMICKVFRLLETALLIMFFVVSQDQDLHSFIDTSMGLESIAASAYIGILQFFNDKVCNYSSFEFILSLTFMRFRHISSAVYSTEKSETTTAGRR
jgi:hypothetical protein